MMSRHSWRQEEKGTTEDGMVGWHHHLDGYEFEQALGVGDDKEAWCATVHDVTVGHDWTTELNWDTLKTKEPWKGILNIGNKDLTYGQAS